MYVYKHMYGVMQFTVFILCTANQLQISVTVTQYSLQGYNHPNAYIATQGPVPAAFPDFWRVIWEYEIPTIVMVTNLREDDKVRPTHFDRESL